MFVAYHLVIMSNNNLPVDQTRFDAVIDMFGTGVRTSPEPGTGVIIKLEPGTDVKVIPGPSTGTFVVV